MEELAIPQLADPCRRENTSAAHQPKTDLVKCLHNQCDTSCTTTSDEEFFGCLRNEWKEAETSSGDLCNQSRVQ